MAKTGTMTACTSTQKKTKPEDPQQDYMWIYLCSCYAMNKKKKITDQSPVRSSSGFVLYIFAEGFQLELSYTCTGGSAHLQFEYMQVWKTFSSPNQNKEPELEQEENSIVFVFFDSSFTSVK